MTLLVSAAARRQVPYPQALGDFFVPDGWQREPSTPVWAADNGAFRGFSEAKFLRMLDRLAPLRNQPRFVTLPDVVGDHGRTLQLFGRWHRELAWRNLNRAFVLQNGITDWKDVPWDYIEAVFIGGDTAFKLGPMVAWLVRLARLMGKWVHMGRVNSVARLDYARSIGCDSCDGSGMASFPAELRRLNASLGQQLLFTA
jgi:hypothetical protein